MNSRRVIHLTQKPAGKTSFLQTRVSECFICIATFMFVALCIFQQSAFINVLPSRLFTVIELGCFVLIVLAELMDGRYSLGSIICLGVGFFVAAVAAHADSAKLVISIALIIVARNFDFKVLARCALIAIILSCAVIVLSWLVGFLNDYIWIQGTRVRHSLGFRYTTYMSHYLLFGFLIYLYLCNGRVPMPLLLLAVVLDFVIFAYTDSRNSFGMVLIVALTLVLFRKWFKSTKPLWKSSIVLAFVFPVIAFVSLYLMICYDPSSSWMSALNSFLGGRLQISHGTYQMYGSSLFGQSLQLVGQGLNANLDKSLEVVGGSVTFIDNSYCDTYVRYGAVVFLLFVAAFSAMLHKAAKNGDRILVLILCVVAAHAFIDSWWLTIQFDFFMVLIGPMLLNRKIESTRIQT